MTETTNTSGAARRAPAVVVGVDGSRGAQDALRWALEEAGLRKIPLRAVHAWTLGYVGFSFGGGAIGGYATPSFDLEGLQHAAEELLAQALTDAGADNAQIEVEPQVIQGLPAEVLTDAARPGDLLVVGSRGHGGFADLLLGSVSQQCVHHATCPVVVVRSPTGTDSADEIATAAASSAPSTTQPTN